MWKKLVEFLKSLMSTKEEKKQEEPTNNEIQPEADLTPEAPQPQPESNESVTPEVGKEDPAYAEPKETDLVNGSVTSFLWKPVSDTNPKVTVLTVSTDTIRSEHLRVKILSNKGVELNIEHSRNKYSTPRGNQLPKDKYGRINFKPGPTVNGFSKHAPLKVGFYIEIDGVQKPVLTCGKQWITINKPAARLEINTR